jgi:hypothetical protein
MSSSSGESRRISATVGSSLTSTRSSRIGRTGDFAFARDRQIELTSRGGEIARYEMRIDG